MRTVNYKEKDYDDIFLEMMQDGYQYGLLSTDERFLDYIKNRQDIENNYCLFLSIYAFEHDKIYEDMTSIYNSNDIDKASGKDLDILGNKFGIARPQARRSSVKLLFTLNTNTPLQSDPIIPSKTIVSTSSGQNYYTIEQATIIRGRNSVEVTAYSSLTGYNSRVDRKTLTACSLGTQNVTNPKGSSGGRGAFSDDEYRRLIKNWTYSHIKGTKEAYELFFSYYDGIDDYRLVPLWDGAGTLKIIVDPDDDWILNDIKTKLLHNVQLFDDDVVVVGAIHRTIDIDCTINVDIDNAQYYSYEERDLIAEKVANAIQTYIDGGYRTNGQYYKGLMIGQDFVPFQAGVFVSQEVPQVRSIDFKDTIKNIDNTILASDFSCVDGCEKCYDKATGVLTSGNAHSFVSPLLYVTNAHKLVSDNKGFTISIIKDDEKLVTTDNHSLNLDNIDLYGAYVLLEKKGNDTPSASISQITIYGSNKPNTINSYNEHIRLTDEEIGVSGNINVTVQDDYINDTYTSCY